MENAIYRYRIKITKLNELKFISHLDWQNLIIKTFRRMGLKLALSNGFSPIPKISFSPAIPLFIESECEFVYFELTHALDENFPLNFKNSISENVKLLELINLPYEQKKPQPLEVYVQWAQYEAVIAKTSNPIFKTEDLKYNVEKCLLSDNLFIKKINKKGFEKNIDYKNSLKLLEIDGEKLIFILKAGQGAEIPALRADDFLKTVFGCDVLFEIKRTKFFDEKMFEI